MILKFLFFWYLIDGGAVFLDSYSFYSLDFDLRVVSESFSMVCICFNIVFLWLFGFLGLKNLNSFEWILLRLKISCFCFRGS